MKYKIMHNYGTYEGYHFADGEFDLIEDAVKHGVAMNNASPFIIVNVVWEPKYITPPSDKPTAT